jgi:hypothetical protein
MLTSQLCSHTKLVTTTGVRSANSNMVRSFKFSAISWYSGRSSWRERLEQTLGGWLACHLFLPLCVKASWQSPQPDSPYHRLLLSSQIKILWQFLLNPIVRHLSVWHCSPNAFVRSINNTKVNTLAVSRVCALKIYMYILGIWNH